MKGFRIRGHDILIHCEKYCEIIRQGQSNFLTLQRSLFCYSEELLTFNSGNETLNSTQASQNFAEENSLFIVFVGS